MLETILSPKPTVVDIGCNDGTLLSNYPGRSTRYGVDPSDIANEIRDGTVVINTVFPSEQALPYFRPAAWTSSHRSRCSMT